MAVLPEVAAEAEVVVDGKAKQVGQGSGCSLKRCVASRDLVIQSPKADASEISGNEPNR